ncbi:hypothetical protein H0H92_004531, partial [Tricholoma furcatifolium]
MIQCLVIPLCLQCRRIDHRKEQKADFDALLAKRVAEKKANVAVIKAVHNVASSNNMLSGLKLPNPAHVLLPKAVMRASVHDDLHQAAWIAVSVAYVVQHGEIKITALTHLVDDACAVVYILLFTDQDCRQSRSRGLEDLR